MTLGTHLDSSGPACIQAEIHCGNPDKSREIWTNLDKPEHLAQELSIHSAKFTVFAKNSRRYDRLRGVCDERDDGI